MSSEGGSPFELIILLRLWEMARLPLYAMVGLVPRVVKRRTISVRILVGLWRNIAMGAVISRTSVALAQRPWMEIVW